MSKTAQVRRFRLKKDVGPHFEPNPGFDRNEPESEENFRDREYAPGEIVKSKRDLERLFVNKFEALDSSDRSHVQSPGGDTHDPNHPDNERPVRDYEAARVHSPDRHMEPEELEGKPELQKLAKGKKVEAESDEDEEEGSEESGPEDITKQFKGAKEAGFKVLKHEDGKMRVHKGDEEEAMVGSKKGFEKQASIKKFIKEHSETE